MEYRDEFTNLGEFKADSDISKLKKIKISNETICCSNVVFFITLITQFLIIYIVFGVYSKDLNNLLKDGKATMEDLSVLIPEVGNTLKIVQQICKAPEYAPYCHSTD